MTNNAQLLPLPEDREEFEMFLIRHLGPGALAGDKISIYDAAELAFAKGIEHGRNALACIKAAKPADALGSLPVVAYELPYGEDGDSFLDWAHHYPEPPAVRLELTDPAQATAEIAKRDAVITGLKGRLGEFSDECFSLKAKLAEVDGLVNVLRAIIDNGPFTTGQKALLDAGSAALATYEAAQGKTPPPEQA